MGVERHHEAGRLVARDVKVKPSSYAIHYRCTCGCPDGRRVDYARRRTVAEAHAADLAAKGYADVRVEERYG